MAAEWHFGTRIKAVREATGVSQVELARRIGLFQDKVSRMEKGHRQVKASELLAICEALQISLVVFFPPGHRVPTTRAIRMAEVVDERMERLSGQR